MARRISLKRMKGIPLFDYSVNHDEDVNYRFSGGLTADIQLLPFLNWNSQLGYEVTNTSSTFFEDPRTKHDQYFFAIRFIV